MRRAGAGVNGLPCGQPADALHQDPDARRRRPCESQARMETAHSASVDLYWIPLGAGGHSVRFNGRVFEAMAAALEHRKRADLYHAALVVELDGRPHTIELAPSPDADRASRGVVATGAVGSSRLGSLRLFRYEVRCWQDGCIPDLAEAIRGPRRLTADPSIARRMLDVVARVPTPVWGRDELGTGEMWNSNSVTAWLIAAAGLPTDHVEPPTGGRAPGWQAGLEVARRSAQADVDGSAGGSPGSPRSSCHQPTSCQPPNFQPMLR
ncbi:MAG: hypothetical protein QOH13_706 [Thermoleophilaceae bacterium]|nr:hypothetical protein [Thermoleophilaceae bacterium]